MPRIFCYRITSTNLFVYVDLVLINLFNQLIHLIKRKKRGYQCNPKTHKISPTTLINQTPGRPTTPPPLHTNGRGLTEGSSQPPSSLLSPVMKGIGRIWWSRQILFTLSVRKSPSTVTGNPSVGSWRRTGCQSLHPGLADLVGNLAQSGNTALGVARLEGKSGPSGNTALGVGRFGGRSGPIWQHFPWGCRNGREIWPNLATPPKGSQTVVTQSCSHCVSPCASRSILNQSV